MLQLDSIELGMPSFCFNHSQNDYQNIQQLVFETYSLDGRNNYTESNHGEEEQPIEEIDSILPVPQKNDTSQTEFTNTPIKTIKNFLGRKKKNSGEKGKHDKYSENNMSRKIKVIIKNEVLELINKEIRKLNLTNIMIKEKRYKYDEIKLLNIKQTQIEDTTVDGTNKFLTLKIKDILSEDISKNYKSHPLDFNAILIDIIYHIESGKNVTSILDKTFLECLKYFRKDEDIINDSEYDCLKGLEKKFETLKESLMKEHDERYADMLIELMKKFEIIYYNKKPRAKRVKKN